MAIDVTQLAVLPASPPARASDDLPAKSKRGRQLVEDGQLRLGGLEHRLRTHRKLAERIQSG